MTETLYEQDYYLWVEKTASLLRNGRFQELDIPNLLEEIESMGRSEKHAIQSNLIVVLLHLLKYKYQHGHFAQRGKPPHRKWPPQKRTSSWLSSIAEHRDRIDISLYDSPSLQPYVKEVFEKCYGKARKRAAIETELPIDTFPAQSPFIPEEALNPDYLPEEGN